MSNKATMILTFIVSTLVPFIQEVVDFIESLKNGQSVSTALRTISADVDTDLKKNSDWKEVLARQRALEKDSDSPYTNIVAKVSSEKTVNPSRFLGNWRDKK